MQSAVYALKPTVGLISRSGCVPFAQSFDTPGPMAKDVWSVAVGMDVMAGEDGDDEWTKGVPRLPACTRVSRACLTDRQAQLTCAVCRCLRECLFRWTANWRSKSCKSTQYYP